MKQKDNLEYPVVGDLLVDFPHKTEPLDPISQFANP